MQDYKMAYKKCANEKKMTFHDFIMLAILKAVKSKASNKFDVTAHIIYRMMSPVTNVNKLKNGIERWDTFRNYSVFHRWRLKIVPPNKTPKSFAECSTGITTVFGDRNINEFFETEEESVEAFSIYHRLITSPPEDTFERFYSYIFVKSGMTPEQIAVQSAHVAFVAGKRFTFAIGKYKPKHHQVYFVLVGLENVLTIEKTLKDNRMGYSRFEEPDMGGIVTAIFTDPLHFSLRGELTSYKKLSIP